MTPCWRIYGLDLSAIPGISAQTLAVCLSELGVPEHLQQHSPPGSASAPSIEFASRRLTTLTPAGQPPPSASNSLNFNHHPDL